MGLIEITGLVIFGILIGFLAAKTLIKSKEIAGIITDAEKINEYLYKVRLKTQKGKFTEVLIFSKYSLNKGLKVLLERKQEEIFVVKKISV
jgi:UPF0716 family protein affecting phage T7 exclusion